MKIYQYSVYHEGDIVKTHSILATSEIAADNLMKDKYHNVADITWEMTQETEAVDLEDLG